MGTDDVPGKQGLHRLGMVLELIRVVLRDAKHVSWTQQETLGRVVVVLLWILRVCNGDFQGIWLAVAIGVFGAIGVALVALSVSLNWPAIAAIAALNSP